MDDVVVIGGGAVGSACAWACSVAGARVTLLQRPDAMGEAWRAAAGMLAAQIDAGPDDPLFKLALAGRGFYRRTAETFRADTGIDIGLIECGVLRVAQTEEERQRLKSDLAWQRQQGHRADWLDAEEVHEGWPWLAPALGGFWSPEDGALNPVQLVTAFRTDAERRGVRIVADAAVAIDRTGEQLLGVVGEKGRYPSRCVVLAGGAWAGRLDNLPRPLSVEPIRGQVAAFPWPAATPPAIVFGEGCYVLRRGDEMIAGTTMEQAGFDSRITEAGIAEVRSRASTLYPPLAGMTPLRTWAGLRPGTPDGLPIIGREPRLPGLWYATGHGRNGILMAGITGEMIARGIGGESIAEELEAVRPERFWDW